MDQIATNFGRGGAILRAAPGHFLADDHIRKHCPAVFAEEPFHKRTDKFTLIPTTQLLDGLRHEGFFPVEVRQGGTGDIERRNFTKHMIKFRRQGETMKQVGDSIPEVGFVNSHDGSCAYSLFEGRFRLACLNGLVVADSEVLHIKIFHKGDILKQVIEGMFTAVAHIKQTEPLIEQMMKTALNQRQQNQFAIAARDLRLQDEDAEITPADILRVNRPQDEGNDLWRIYNRAQENLVRGGISYQTRDSQNRVRQRRIREVKSIDANMRLNRQLWDLAVERLAA